MPPAPQAPPGYVKTNVIPGVGYMGMVKYLQSRGYSDELAKTLAANIEANPDVKSNQDLISGAQAWAAKTAPGTSDVSPALAMDNYRNQMAAEEAARQAQGQKADSLASYFQRLGVPADQAIAMARHTTGTPDAASKAPMDHIASQVNEHPVIPPELYQSVLGAPQTISGN